MGKPTKPVTLLREKGQLVLEICHFNQDLNPAWDTKGQLVNLRELGAPVLQETRLWSCEEKSFQRIREYFFEEAKMVPLGADQLEFNQLIIPNVLLHRKGPYPLMMLLFLTLLEEAGIKAQVTSCRKRYLIKVQLNERIQIVDFANKGEFLTPHEIVNLINQGFDFSKGSLNSCSLVVEYLSWLKKAARTEKRLQVLGLVHSYLMRYQPFNLKHLSERAMVAYETGDYLRAIEDIRSYFLYKQPEFTNRNLMKVYKLALRSQQQLRQINRQRRDTFSDSIESL